MDPREPDRGHCPAGDLGPDYYQRRAHNRRTIDYHVRELEALGLEVTLCRIPEPEPGQAPTTPAA
jgi:hypothetical protein